MLRRFWYRFRRNAHLARQAVRLRHELVLSRRRAEHLEEIIAVYRDALGQFQAMDHVKTAESKVYLETIRKAVSAK